jgi:hypothetical protein
MNTAEALLAPAAEPSAAAATLEPTPHSVSLRAHGMWHRVLILLEDGERHRPQKIADTVGQHDFKAAEFAQEVLQPMAAAGCVMHCKHNCWAITPTGHSALQAANTSAALMGGAAVFTQPPPDGTPLVSAPHKALLTTGRRHPGLSAAERMPPLRREGTHVHGQIPSRMGNVLRYRDGRITDLAGRPLEKVPT